MTKIEWLIPKVKGKRRFRGKFLRTETNTSFKQINGLNFALDYHYYKNAIEIEYVLLVSGTMAKQICN